MMQDYKTRSKSGFSKMNRDCALVSHVRKIPPDSVQGKSKHVVRILKSTESVKC